MTRAGACKNTNTLILELGEWKGILLQFYRVIARYSGRFALADIDTEKWNAGTFFPGSSEEQYQQSQCWRFRMLSDRNPIHSGQPVRLAIIGR